MTRLRLTLLLVVVSGSAFAGGTLRIDENKLISVGIGLRVMGTVAAPDLNGPPGWDRTRPDFAVDNALLGLTGQFRPEAKLQLNVSRQPTGELRFLDTIGQFEPLPYLKLWAGRFLPPVDRASLIGPLFAATWDVPFVGPVGPQPGGRDDGFAFWGDILPGKLRYQAGAFVGARGESNPLFRPMYAGRLVWNLYGTEPGYYHTGTTFGGRDLLSFGVSARDQHDGAGKANARGDISTLEADALLEQHLPGNGGVVNAEAAFYRHDNGGVVDPKYIRGIGYYALIGYLLPNSIGPGHLQFVARYESLKADDGPVHDRKDLNVVYVLQGHPLRLNGVVFHEKQLGVGIYGVRIGAQLIL